MRLFLLQKHPLITFLILIFFNHAVFAQNDSLQIEKYRIALKVAPVALADPYYPALQIGMEVNLPKRWSIQGEFGYIVKESGLAFFDDLVFPHDRKGFKLRGETRFYTKRKKRRKHRRPHYFNAYNMEGPYIALEYFHATAQSTEYETFVDENYVYCREAFIAKRSVNGGHLKFGQQIIENGILFDFFFGIGTKNLNITHTDRQCNGYMDEFIFSFGNHDEGNYPLLNLTMSIKLGYAF